MLECNARLLLSERAGNGKPIKVGLLSNPDSGRNKRGLEPVHAILREFPETLHREAKTPGQVREVLREFAHHGVELIALNSGDGTVQAALSTLFNDRPFSSIPLLALLRGGSTNVNIGDVGIQGDRNLGLRRLLRWARLVRDNVELVQRPVLRVTGSTGATPVYGMLFGAGMITRGVDYYHTNIHGRGVYDGLATGLTTLRMLLSIIRGSPDPADTLVADVAIDPKSDHSPHTGTEGAYLLLLISSLERLFLGIHPFWGAGSGPLRFTWVDSRPAHPLLAMPPLFIGHTNRFGTPENGYHSQRINALLISMDGHYTLDGELYLARHANGPVAIDNDGPVTFIRL